MTDRCSVRPRLTLAAILLLAGCGGEPEREQPANTAAAPMTSLRSPTPAADLLTGAPAGVALPLAEPAPSALFHAAYQRVEDDWVPVLFLCDGVDGDRVKLITTPTAHGLSTLLTYAKTGFNTKRETVRLGDSDPGAGSIYRALEREDGTEIGNVHSINPGMLGDAAATTLPTLIGITDEAETTRCRWAPRGRVLLAASRRSVLVTAEPDGSYTYRSFDYDKPGKVIDAGGGATSEVTTTVTGGRLVAAEPKHEVYEFTNKPWTYRVEASANNAAAGASLTVLRDGKPVQVETAAAYEMAAKRIE